MEKFLNVMFAGASGVGKTTSAKLLVNSLNTEEPSVFISGSVSDLLPDTKNLKHSEMLSRDSQKMAMEDYQILNLRKKLFDDKIDDHNIITDRSFLDLAAYFLYKQADKMPACEIEAFLTLCKKLTNIYCTHLIMFDFTSEMLKEWVTEDNGKRITSNYFQMEISNIMKMVLDIWGVTKYAVEIDKLKGGVFTPVILEQGATKYTSRSIHGETSILVVREANLEIRNKLIWQYIHGQV